ncbi:hypothetical protein CN378_12700 [Bacillus sp. AFS015802]|uniref:hypothetical protein n=1 Tax=Bacillus sp. AFS015802 TaxID=2033486 RepID=UPI000BF883D1|nr:hypothetical protein [Bacillus sp. AFS015802]PFA66866.1 hypothetical protein CN378_12700 [Bacillus sp. AFS015802]
MNTMISTTKIAPIANKHYVSGQDIAFGVDCYEKGMIEILRGVALAELHQSNVGVVHMSKHAKNMAMKCETEFKSLQANLSENKKQMLSDYDEQFHDLLAAETTDHFVEGFIRGYRYLKSQIESGLNLGEEYDNE